MSSELVQSVREFDPDGPGGDGLYGLECSPAESLIHVVSVPWQATASYRRGTRNGPEAIYRASVQVDLHDPVYGPVWEGGIAWIDGEERVGGLQDDVEADALAVIEAGGAATPSLRECAARVDAAAERVHDWVQAHACRAFEQGRIPAVVGGGPLEPPRAHP